MFGKRHTKQSKNLMSISRTGKTGENATAWKGGKRSLTSRIKGIQHTRFNWFFRVYKRDKFKCVICESKEKIDAHHIYPISKAIKDLLYKTEKIFETDHEKIEWLLTQGIIKDENLNNGITLCRECHRKEHGKKWGSHNQ